MLDGWNLNRRDWEGRVELWLVEREVVEVACVAGVGRIVGNGHAESDVRGFKVRVAADGRVLEARAVSGPFALLVPAETAVRTFRYQPAIQDSQPIEATTYVTLDFKYTE